MAGNIGNLHIKPSLYPSVGKKQWHIGVNGFRVVYWINVATAIFKENLRSLNVEFSDAAVVKLLREGSEQAFGQVFKTWFKPLHAYAFTILRDDAAAEEMVQNVFYSIWRKRERLEINGAVKSYLYRAVHNESMNYLKHQKVRENYRVYYASRPVQESEPTDGRLREAELSEHIRKALNELPAQCRMVFQLSRFEEMKYREIAGELGISIKTVENQMGKALRLMRTKLAAFLPDAPVKAGASGTGAPKNGGER